MKKNTDLLKKLELETTNTGVVHLWLEGMFWKAYERSAYVFVQRISGYKPYKRFVRMAGGEVLAIGFPTKAFDKVTDGRNVEWVDGKHCVMSGFTVDAREMKEYYNWKKEVPSFPYTVVEPPAPQPAAEGEKPQSPAKSPKAEPAPEVRPQKNLPGTETAAIPPVETVTARQVVEELRRFRMENATPLDCMLFLSRLIRLSWESPF